MPPWLHSFSRMTSLAVKIRIRPLLQAPPHYLQLCLIRREISLFQPISSCGVQAMCPKMGLCTDNDAHPNKTRIFFFFFERHYFCLFYLLLFTRLFFFHYSLISSFFNTQTFCRIFLRFLFSCGFAACNVIDTKEQN